MITGFKCYKYYMAIKLHFTKDNYNVFETRGHVKGSEHTFLARNDRFLFEKIARKYQNDKEVVQFFVSNFAYGNDGSVYNLQEADENYTVWTKRKQSLTRVFTDDLAKIILYCEKNNLRQENVFDFVNGQYPAILKMYIGKQITIETMYLLNRLDGYMNRWYNNPMILWEEDARRIVKCDGFVKFDNEKLNHPYNTFLNELKEL